MTKNTRTFGERILYQIEALKNFGEIKKGDLGGWIEAANNLSQDGLCWVYGDAWVYDDAQVYGDARVCGDAQVYGDARVCGDARVYGKRDMLACGPIGSRGSYTTMYKSKTGVIVSCGCFLGNLDQFEMVVHKTHGGTIHEQEYMALIALARLRFGGDDNIVAPTINPKDLQPHGHWIVHHSGGLICSHCNRYIASDWRSLCCPTCGARLDGEVEYDG